MNHIQACWCQSCDIAKNGIMRSRMSVCPECGDKRCLRASHHDNACTTPTMSDEKATAIANVAHETIRALGAQAISDTKRARINELAAQYAGQMAGGVLADPNTKRLDHQKLVTVARALATAVVEAEE